MKIKRLSSHVFSSCFSFHHFLLLWHFFVLILNCCYLHFHLSSVSFHRPSFSSPLLLEAFPLEHSLILEACLCLWKLWCISLTSKHSPRNFTARNFDLILALAWFICCLFSYSRISLDPFSTTIICGYKIWVIEIPSLGGVYLERGPSIFYHIFSPTVSDFLSSTFLLRLIVFYALSIL